MIKTIIIVVVLVAVAFAAGVFYKPWTEQPGIDSDTEVTTEEEAANTTPEDAAPEGSVTVTTSALTDGQRKLLGALGIDADSITVTPEMMACAEAKVGAARIEEIKAGDTPTFLEGLSLLGCYRK